MLTSRNAPTVLHHGMKRAIAAWRRDADNPTDLRKRSAQGSLFLTRCPGRIVKVMAELFGTQGAEHMQEAAQALTRKGPSLGRPLFRQLRPDRQHSCPRRLLTPEERNDLATACCLVREKRQCRQFDVTAGPDSTPIYPKVRKIRPVDLKDALAKGIDDFLAMPSSHCFPRPDLPDRRPCSAHAFSAHGGFRSGWSLRRNWLV
jgi:hypothetical protein